MRRITDFIFIILIALSLLGVGCTRPAVPDTWQQDNIVATGVFKATGQSPGSVGAFQNNPKSYRMDVRVSK